jgi:hypothetical protein
VNSREKVCHKPEIEVRMITNKLYRRVSVLVSHASDVSKSIESLASGDDVTRPRVSWSINQ